MKHDGNRLIETAEIRFPLIGLYDTDRTNAFPDLSCPPPDRHVCVFAYFRHWCSGGYVKIAADQFGCGGAGYWMCNVRTRPRDAFVRFLADEEGLKASHELMNRWLDETPPFQPQQSAIVIGPLKAGLEADLRSVTFFVNPDQLGLMTLAANYHAGPDDPAPVIAPFGSGCSQLIALFHDLEMPQAVIGATDIAMRSYLPPEVLAFTVTVPMYERMCTLDDDSFLTRDFWKRLQRARSVAGSDRNQ